MRTYKYKFGDQSNCIRIGNLLDDMWQVHDYFHRWQDTRYRDCYDPSAWRLLGFSLTVPEFTPLREVLLSAKFLMLFVGGYARISFENTPNFWTVGIMVLINILVNAVIAPVWAILTTHLYMEQAAINGQQSAIIK